MTRRPRFFGKYRGKVENNVDPLLQGRVQVSVPAVLGDGRLCWAMPCVPYAGPQVGLFIVPPVGANVWVEFEARRPRLPDLDRRLLGAGEVPASARRSPQMKVLKTDGVTLTMNDCPGAAGFTLEVSPPAVPAPLKLVFDADGIELSQRPASVKLTRQRVVNNGALEVI